MAYRKLASTDAPSVAVMPFNIALTASDASALSTLVEAIQETMQFVAASNPSIIISNADAMAKLIVGRARPNNLLLEERIARMRTVLRVSTETRWLTAEEINRLQRPPPQNKSFPASDWKRRGRIFSVQVEGAESFADYQFDQAYQPLPIIKDTLKALGPVADPWILAAWFHFPNAWIRDSEGKAIAPKDALDRPSDILHAATMRNSSYIA